jgi:toxin ParE1/3/4
MTIEYHPAASGELNQAARYYEQQSAGLGHEFLNEFEFCVRQISDMPTRWMMVEHDVQRALMKRFPFCIYFRSLDDRLRITVVKHVKRHPNYGRSRR